MEGACRFEHDTRKPFDLGLEPGHSAILNRVFKARVPPIRAIAVITLCDNNGLSNGIDLVGCDKAKDICKPGKCFDVAMVHAKSTTRGDVVSHQLIVLNDGNEAKILREDIHIVGWRYRKARLEFARQIGRPVDWFGFRLASCDEFLVEPNFMISVSLREREFTPRPGVVVNPPKDGVTLRIRRSHHIAVHVAAGRDGVQQDLVHALNERLYVPL